MRYLVALLGCVALIGCQQRTIADGAVQLGPHRYAMEPWAFDRWAANQGYRPGFITVFNTTDLCGLFRPYPSSNFTDIKPYFDTEGLCVYHPKGRYCVIAIKASDPHHLTFENVCALLHETGHAEDDMLGHVGASNAWKALALCPEGAFFLTHDDVNAVLRREGYIR